MTSKLRGCESTAPRRALLVWEQGGALGHHAALGALAARLVRRGVHVDAVLRRLDDAALWFPAEVQLHAAIPPPRTPRGVPHVDYADVLSDLGWRQPRKLGKRVASWRALVDRLDPDVVVLNSAPTVHLALRESGRRVIGFGAPWFAPSPGPLPALQWWMPAPPPTDREGPVVATANAARAPGTTALQHLSDVWSDTQWVLHGPPALDPWLEGRRARTVHAGITAVLDHGRPAEWPDGDGLRVFAYLKHRYPHVDRVLAALDAAGCRTLAYVAGGTRRSGARLRVTDAPVSIETARRGADLVVTHSALTTGCAFLDAGVPGLFLPMHLEQLASARCASMRLKGAGALPARAVPGQLERAIRMLTTPEVRAATVAQAPSFAPYRDGMSTVEGVVMRV